MSAEDPSLWKEAMGVIAAGASALIGLVWMDNKRRVDKLEFTVEGKADKGELDRQRDHIAKLFDGQAEVREDMNEGFQSIRDMLHENLIKIMSELSKKADR